MLQVYILSNKEGCEEEAFVPSMVCTGTMHTHKPMHARAACMHNTHMQAKLIHNIHMCACRADPGGLRPPALNGVMAASLPDSRDASTSGMDQQVCMNGVDVWSK